MIVKRGEGSYPRVYRPLRIPEIYGQEEATDVVRGGLDNKSLANTLLFHGVSGTGKTTLARIVARGLNCKKGQTSQPCCECDSCKLIPTRFSEDYKEINASEVTGIDHMRELVKGLDYHTTFLDKRVFIFDECHGLSIPAQRLLLKVVEDAHEDDYFVLCSTNPEKIIEPLRNRCIDTEFKEVPNEEIKRLLEDVCKWERIKYEDDVLDSIVKKSKGMPRNALFLLQKYVDLGRVEKMRNGKVESIDREKGSNVLIVAPHGVYHDDDYTGLIAKHLADNLEGYAVINEKYQKPETVGFTQPDLDKDLVNLNCWDQIDKYDQVKEDFLEPIERFKDAIVKEHGGALIVQIHGIRNGHMNLVAKTLGEYQTRPEDLHILIGYGQSNGGNPSLTADFAKTVQPLIGYLKANNMNAAIAPTTEIIGIDGEKKIYCGNDPNGLNQKLHGPNVQCVQLEIRKSPFREDSDEAEKMAELLGKVLSPLIIGKSEGDKLPAQTTQTTDLGMVSETQADMELVERAHRTLAQIFSEHFENAMLKAGDFVIREFYNGQLESVRKKKPVKDKSLYQLIQSLQNGASNVPSKSWIYNAVNLVVDNNDFSGFHTYGKLLLSHKVLLLSIDSREDKRKLIKETVDKGYTIKQLRDRISEFKNNARPKTDQMKNLPQLIRKPELLFSKDFSSVRAVESLLNLKLPTLNKLQDKAEEKITDISKYIEGLESDIQTQSGYIEQYRRFIDSVETAKKQKAKEASETPKRSSSSGTGNGRDVYRSALQKAIRHCEVNAARYFARRLTQMGTPGTNFSRLLVIAAEDVGLADPTLINYVRDCDQEFSSLLKQHKIKKPDAINHPNLCELIDKAVIAAAVSYKSRLIPQASFATLYKIYNEETFNHTASEYEERFLKAIQDKDEGKALYYAYILEIFLHETDLVLSMIREESSKTRNEKWIDKWMKEYNRSHQILYLAGSVVMLFRPLEYPHGEYQQLISKHLHKPITAAEIPNRAYDKHTIRGKRMGRGLEHFLSEAATVRNERFRNDWNEAGIKAYLEAEKKRIAENTSELIDAIEKKFRKHYPRRSKGRAFITNLPFKYEEAVLTQARTAGYKPYAFVVEFHDGTRKFMKGPFQTVKEAQGHVIFNEVKRKLASKYVHPIQCEVNQYGDSVFLECEELGPADFSEVKKQKPTKLDNRWCEVLDDSSSDVVPDPFSFLKSITKRNENIWVEVIVNYCFRWIFGIGDAAPKNLMLEKSTGKVYSTDEIRLKRKDADHQTVWCGKGSEEILSLVKDFANSPLLNDVLHEIKRWKNSLKNINSKDFPITKGIKERIDRLLKHPRKVLGLEKTDEQVTEKHAKKKAKVFGAREWAKSSVNCCLGCSHDCLYCYAKEMAIGRPKGGIESFEEWKEEKVIQEKVEKNYRLRNGTQMFPSSHDITPKNFSACFTVLKKLLKAGNRVLVVSKPHLECIKKICDSLGNQKDRILFRFTIGAVSNELLSFWEPNAPSYEERKASLKHAHDAGFATSVSVEPMLDSENIGDLVTELSPLVTDAIWIGKMKGIRTRVKANTGGALNDAIKKAIERIEAGQTDEKIKQIYHRFKDNSLVKWKESIKKVVGLELAKEPGMDV